MTTPSRAAWWLLALFIVSLPAVTTRIYASDEVQYYAYLRSLWFDRDVSFENEYEAFYARGVAADPLFHETFLERRTETGRRINFGTIGCAILWSPFFAVGDVAAALTGAPRDGYSRPYVAAVAYGSACYGFLALLIALRLAREISGRRPSAALAVWLGTPLCFYMYVAPPMSHACSAFAVALFVWTWWRVRRSWSLAGAAALGLTAGLMAMVREQDASIAAGPALDWLLLTAGVVRREGARAAGRLVVAAVAGAGVTALALVPQLAAYTALNGYPGPSRLVTRKMTWTAPHALGVLLSPEHGWLVWTPLAALAIAGLVLLATRRRLDGGDARRFGACALLMIAAQVYVAGSVESWTVAGAFGQRRFVAVSALLVVGLVAAMAAARSRVSRALLASACVLGAWWNLGLMAQYGAGLMDRQRLEPARNAYTTFVLLPRLAPGLAWRYVFDRASFYGTRPRADTPGGG